MSQPVRTVRRPGIIGSTGIGWILAVVALIICVLGLLSETIYGTNTEKVQWVVGALLAGAVLL